MIGSPIFLLPASHIIPGCLGIDDDDDDDDDDARWWRSFFSVLSSRVLRPSPTQRVLFFFIVVEEKGFEYSEYDDDSERSDFVIDDAMLFVVFVFKLEGDE